MASSSTFQAYLTECRVAFSRATYAKQTTPVASNGGSLPPKTEYVTLSPRNGANVLGVLIEANASLTAAGAENPSTTITVGPTTTPVDILDEMIAQTYVCPAPAMSPRSSWLTRLTLEETERICLNLAGLSYPRSAPAAFSGAGSRTDSNTIFVPVGGPAAALQIQPPPITAVWAANVSASWTYNIYIISGDNPTVVTYRDIQTSVQAVGPQDMGNWFPADMAPQFLICANETTTSISTLFITAQDSTVLLDFETTGPISYAQVAVAPDTTASYDVLDFGLAGKRFQVFRVTIGTEGARLFGFLEFTGGTTTNPPTSSAPTPAPPASAQTGATTSGGGVAPTTTGGNVGLRTGGAGSIIRRRKS